VSLALDIGTFELDFAKAGLLGLLAAVSVLAVNQTAAVYHDGLRTSIPEMWRDGRTSRSLAAYSYSISIGFIVAYALPYSLATGIIIIHIILLTADMIGLWFEERWQAVAIGAAYGFVITLVVDAFVFGVQQIAGYGPSLDQLFAPLVFTFPLLAAVAIAHQYGFRWGVGSAIVTLALWKGADVLLEGDGGAPLTSSGGAIALTVMTIGMVVYALRGSATSTADAGMYDEGIDRMRKHWPYLIGPPILIAVAASQAWVAGEPFQLVMLASGSREAAAAIALFSTVGFLPMIALSGVVSGVWNQDGYPDWYLGAGYVLPDFPWLAGLAGLALIVLELTSLRRVAQLLVARPAIHGVGSAIRDALDVVPTLSILAGAVFAAIQLAGPFGAAVVIAAYAFNDAKGRPIMPLAVPVFAFLIVVLLVQAARAMGLS
jgi:Protein of unknown function